MSIKPITETLRHLRGGELLDEASRKLAEIVKVVDSIGKAGKLTIELHVKKLSRSGALEGKLSLWYDLVRPDVVLNDAVDQIIEQVETATELPILYGAIEK